MGVARENLLGFEHEHGYVHAQEPWTIFAWARTAPRQREVLVVRDPALERHIDCSIFFHWVKLLIFFMFSDILKAFYLYFFHEHEQVILFFCCVWKLPEFDACPMHSALRASGIGWIKVQCACIGFVLHHSKR